MIHRIFCMILLLAVLGVTETNGEVSSIWNMYKWGPNAQAWCRFRCAEKIRAGTIFEVNFSGPTTNFTTFGNLKTLSANGNTYILENNYDMWPWGDGQYCQFQFGLVYDGIHLKGNCSYHVPPSEQKPSRGIDLATWDNSPRQTGFWRYQGRCTVACNGTYEPGTMIVAMDLDRATTNFNGFGAFKTDMSLGSYTKTWTMVNQKRVRSQYGLCHFDFELDHQNEYPSPKGTCYIV